MYNIADMIDSLENAITHLSNAEEALTGMTECEYETKDIISVRKQLEQLLNESNEILYKQQEKEQKQLEYEYEKNK